jgi:hypothetical protein
MAFAAIHSRLAPSCNLESSGRHYLVVAISDDVLPMQAGALFSSGRVRTDDRLHAENSCQLFFVHRQESFSFDILEERRADNAMTKYNY